MRVMLLETDRHASVDVAKRLAEAGHDVVRCHGDGEPLWPCNGLRDDARCPLEDGVDVIVTVRAHPYPRPMASEDGVSCALRHHIPLVVAGPAVLDPFGPWAVVETSPDTVVAACEEAVRMPLRRHSDAALGEVRRLLEVHGLPSDGATAEAVRDARHVAVRVDPGVRLDQRLGDLIAVRVAQAIRALDGATGTVDVAVTR
jgi:hypothetical protein